jgi:DNA-binding NarL/FixJ family response regulator
MSDIRVVLADDHVVLRAGLRALLEAEMGIEVVGEASTGD